MVVPARGKALVPTDLSIAIPEGTYARIGERPLPFFRVPFPAAPPNCLTKCFARSVRCSSEVWAGVEALHRRGRRRG
jgi:hypothetical protein